MRVKAPGVLVLNEAKTKEKEKRKEIRNKLTGGDLKLKGGTRLDKPKQSEPWPENERIEYLMILKKKMLDRFGTHREWMENVPDPSTIGKMFDENGRLVPIKKKKENEVERVRVKL